MMPGHTQDVRVPPLSRIPPLSNHMFGHCSSPWPPPPLQSSSASQLPAAWLAHKEKRRSSPPGHIFAYGMLDERPHAHLSQRQWRPVAPGAPSWWADDRSLNHNLPHPHDELRSHENLIELHRAESCSIPEYGIDDGDAHHLLGTLLDDPLVEAAYQGVQVDAVSLKSQSISPGRAEDVNQKPAPVIALPVRFPMRAQSIDSRTTTLPPTPAHSRMGRALSVQQAPPIRFKVSVNRTVDPKIVNAAKSVVKKGSENSSRHNRRILTGSPNSIKPIQSRNRDERLQLRRSPTPPEVLAVPKVPSMRSGRADIIPVIEKSCFEVLAGEDEDIVDERDESDAVHEESDQEHHRKRSSSPVVRTFVPTFQRAKNHSQRLWSHSEEEEKKQIVLYWLSLSRSQRSALVKVDKSTILRRLKLLHRRVCSCAVCSRRRAVMEDEIEQLYNDYFAELSMEFREIRSKMKAAIEQDPEYLCSIVNPLPCSMDPRMGLAVRGGVLTLSDDSLKREGQRFLEMIEKYAEYQLRLEDQAVKDAEGVTSTASGGSAAQDPSDVAPQGPPTSLISSGVHDDCPDDHHNHDNIDHLDNQDEFISDDEDDYEELTMEHRLEEARYTFEIFAGKIFEQRLLRAFRELMSKEKQQALLEEEDEEKAMEEFRRQRRHSRRQKRRQRQRERRHKGRSNIEP